MTTTNPGLQAATNPAPHEGGSYVVGKDGKRARQEFTIQPGEPGHGEQEARSAEGATGKEENPKRKGK